MSSSSAPPPLPARPSTHYQPQHQQTQPSNPITGSISQPDEPPPAYTPSPADHTTVLEVGPQYPFGSTDHQQAYQPNDYSNPALYGPPHGYQNSPQPSYPPYHYLAQHSQPTHPHVYPGVQTAPNPNPDLNGYPIPSSLPGFVEPTPYPTPGRPLLYEDRILVYPYIDGAPYFCSKCCNTGFKSFDPSRPCRKCWTKYGKPWQAVKVAPISNTLLTNLQRPLPPNGTSVLHQHPIPLVVRPGDPRIGGRLCLNCNGSGTKYEDVTLFNVFLGGGGSEVCPGCRGVGRIFV